MNALEKEYLKKNNFTKNENGRLVSQVISKRQFVEDGGFQDERQRNIIKAQFGNGLASVEEMKIFVDEVNSYEFDVEISWRTSDGEMHESKIGGEGIYELVSQAIVLADIEEF